MEKVGRIITKGSFENNVPEEYKSGKMDEVESRKKERSFVAYVHVEFEGVDYQLFSSFNLEIRAKSIHTALRDHLSQGVGDHVVQFLKIAESVLVKLEKQVKQFKKFPVTQTLDYTVIKNNCLSLKKSFKAIEDCIEGWEPFCETIKQHYTKVDELTRDLHKVYIARSVSIIAMQLSGIVCNALFPGMLAQYITLTMLSKLDEEDEFKKIKIEYSFCFEIDEDSISEFNVDVPITFKGFVSWLLKVIEEDIACFDQNIKKFKGPCVTKRYEILSCVLYPELKKKLEDFKRNYDDWEPFREKTRQLTTNLHELALELASRTHKNGIICEICEITTTSGGVGGYEPLKIQKLKTVKANIAFHLKDVVRGIVKLEQEVKAFRGPCITKASEEILDNCNTLKKTLEVLEKNVDGLEDLRLQINQYIMKIDKLKNKLCSRRHLNGRACSNCEVKQKDVTKTTSSGQGSSGRQNSEPVEDNVSLQLKDSGQKIKLLDSNMKAVRGPCFAKYKVFKGMQVDCNNLKKALEKLPMLNTCREERLQRHLYILKIDEIARALASPPHKNGVFICPECQGE